MVILTIGLSTKYKNEVKNIILDSINKKYISSEYFELEKRMVLINYIKNSSNINYIFDQFVSNYLMFDYSKINNINFIENLYYDECINLLKRLDFSNYTVVSQIKE